jgi:hypothetical protein
LCYGVHMTWQSRFDRLLNDYGDSALNWTAREKNGAPACRRSAPSPLTP